MFNLYGNIAGWKLLDVSKDEVDILNSIEDYIRANTKSNYLIIDRQLKEDIIYKYIENEKQFEEYKEEYSQKNKILTKKRGI